MSAASVKTVRDVLTAFAGQDLVAFVRDTAPEQMHAVMEAVFDPDIEVIGSIRARMQAPIGDVTARFAQ